MTPPRKPNGRLACGCLPYHEAEEIKDFHLCVEGERLYQAMIDSEPWTPEGAAARQAYIEHIGLESEVPEEVLA